MTKLEQMQKERIAAEAQAQFELAALEYHTSRSQPDRSQTGFVSQPQPVAMAAVANRAIPTQQVDSAPRL